MWKTSKMFIHDSLKSFHDPILKRYPQLEGVTYKSMFEGVFAFFVGLLCYSVLTTLFMGLGLMDPVFAIWSSGVLAIMLYGFGYHWVSKQYDVVIPKESKLLTFSGHVFDIGKALIWALYVLVLSFIVVNLLPGDGFSFEVVKPSVTSSGQFSYITAFIFVLLQPLFEGYLVRGILTSAVNTSYRNFWVQQFVPVAIGAFVHIGGNFDPSVIGLAIMQAFLFQWLRERYGIGFSIMVNVWVNVILMFMV